MTWGDLLRKYLQGDNYMNYESTFQIRNFCCRLLIEWGKYTHRNKDNQFLGVLIDRMTVNKCMFYSMPGCSVGTWHLSVWGGRGEWGVTFGGLLTDPRVITWVHVGWYNHHRITMMKSFRSSLCLVISMPTPSLGGESDQNSMMNSRYTMSSPK